METFADVNISEIGNLTDVNELFELQHENDDTDFYVSKKKYHFHNEELDFDYHYTLRVLDLYEWTGEESQKGKLGFELKIVPTVEFISKEYLKGLKTCMCIEDYPDEDITMYDLSDYGTGVEIGYQEIKDVNSWNDPKITEELNFIATCMPFIEAKGEEYYFDNTWNKIGNDGWDSLKHEILDEPLFY